MKYFWGTLLIAIGVVFLGASLGTWDINVLAELIRFWPLILVFAGLELLTRGYKWQPFLMVAAVILAGFFVWDIVLSPQPVLKEAKKNTERKTTESDIRVATGNAKEGSVIVKTGAVDFTIDGSSENLVEGTFVSNLLSADVKTVQNGSLAKTTIETSSLKNARFWFGNVKNDLDLKLTRQIPVNLSVETGASSLNFDLSEIILSGLSVKAGASSIDLTLGEKIENNARVQIDSGASSIKIAVPEEIGVRLKSETGLSGQNFNGFTKTGDNYYENKAYQTASKKIEMIIKAGVSSIEINQQ